MIDFKALLKKYMAHVGREEGTAHVPDNTTLSPEMSQEEIDYLQKLDEEILSEAGK